ncbi:glycosyltransferase [Prochlorococcus sp. MIT 0604]|uniref:glycosyltransferase n=1 Tax=Prochlorococcus sp. MIT 0604 TaxID=1501268 RepID=UPI0004F6B4B5|nr:glycosyltransferase [Prochlorococcus sp. MIT 0604]AIQ95491.1 glycosyltransferase involved in cell wall bioproteinsi [Prochlorococcus sp. MIT 0604]
MNYKISIITVTLNSKEDLIKTISSVQRQTYRNFQHIIKDGFSNDGTKVINFGDFPNTEIYFAQDSGVYDAMNQGFKYAIGELVIFLNAGDILLSNQALENINYSFCRNSLSTCLIGYTAQVNETNINNFSLLGFGWFYKKIPLIQFPHPSFILKRDVACKIKPLFDNNLKIASDYKQQILLRKKNLFKPIYLDQIITLMPLGGKSTQNLISYFNGFLETLKFSFNLYKVRFLYIFFLKIFIRLIKKIIKFKYPKRYSKQIIEYYSKDIDN